MKGNTLRWIIAVVMLLAITLGLSCPSIVEAEGGKLPLDFTVGGSKTEKADWEYDGKTPIGYKDDTIEVTSEKGSVVLPSLEHRKKNVKHETWVVRIRIRDASQLRTAVSKDTYKGGGQASAEDIAKSKNAVAAMNGDFFKYEKDVGYVVRQGELVRDASDNKRVVFDMLLVDSEGDFHVIPSADTAKVNEFTEAELAPEGRTILDTFNLGPALIVDGEVQDIAASEAAKQGRYQWKYPQQRIALVQTGHLEYAIVEVFGRTDGTAGMSLAEFADFIKEKVPDAITAYNFDGGGSTNLVLNGKKIHKTPGLREITDIIYFASAKE